MMIGLGRAAYTNDPVGIQLSIVVREHGTHPSSRTEKGSIACRKSEAPREPDAFRDEERKRKRARKAKPSPFRATKPCNRPMGQPYVVTLPAFRGCLGDGPDAAEAGERITHLGGTRDRRPSRSVLRPTGNTGETQHKPIDSRALPIALAYNSRGLFNNPLLLYAGALPFPFLSI